MNQASNDTAMAELRLRLEAHQRMLARWEAKVARQLEKIVGLQKNVSRTFSTESAPATPFPGMPGRLGFTPVLLLKQCATSCDMSAGLRFTRHAAACDAQCDKGCEHCSIYATAVVISNAALAASDQCSKAAIQNCLLRLSLAYHDLQVKAFLTIL